MHKLLRFKKIHYYVIPLVALTVWWGMLIALLSAWSLQGKPVYAFMSVALQQPVYISDVAATNLQPLFIACTGFQMFFFVGTLVMEYVLRQKHKLQPYVSRKQVLFARISIVLAVLGQLAILFVLIFKTTTFHAVHITMVALFIFFIFWACFFNFLNSFLFGNLPARLHPNHERVIFGKHKWANLYMVSFFIKLFWLLAAAAFAICFGYYMGALQDSMSASFEWTIAFWYGLLLVLWSLDLFPSAVKHYRLRHPEEFSKEFIDRHQEPVVIESSLDTAVSSAGETEKAAIANTTEPATEPVIYAERAEPLMVEAPVTAVPLPETTERPLTETTERPLTVEEVQQKV